MKNLFIPILLGVAVSSFGQNIRSIDDMQNGGYISYTAVSNSGTIKYSDIDGTPYLNKNLRITTIANDYEKVTARYDSYQDVVEFKQNDELRVLPKEAQFSRIEFTSPSETLVLENFPDNPLGYYFLLVEGNASLYKEVRTVFNEAEKAKSPYADDKLANFKLMDPSYYIKVGSKIFKKPKNQKEIIEALPGKKSEINSFVKKNNIKFNDEKDLVRFVKFLNQ
ncbi:hypothetical protein [Frigoriflavimonas asaccharolytica]|uniref:Uncharacterized protein n=1 Tax=Frigoriflavimonas asaccharolytica TaxID=2735899 RepID=A0A8J8G7T2_9FLAO|nr:hypothetical protein [Frigoriflavimonas asaccharolytica]NRS92541.1 hypothetical protein [Frigoriflavimonas asaccharolytica]